MTLIATRCRMEAKLDAAPTRTMLPSKGPGEEAAPRTGCTPPRMRAAAADITEAASAPRRPAISRDQGRRRERG